MPYHHDISHRKQQGFGLALMAIILVALGMIAGTVMMRAENQAVWQPKTQASGNLARVREAMIQYQRDNHSLPCAAPRGLLPSDANYGKSISPCTNVVAGNVMNGTIHIGAVPTRTLGLPDEAANDKWGNRLTYGMTIALADPYAFTTGSGALSVSGNTTLANAAFVVFSHGQDGIGAYSAKSGIQGKACDASAGTAQENCDDDASFVVQDINSDRGSSYFDDQVVAERVDIQAQGLNTPCQRSVIGSAQWQNTPLSENCINNTYTDFLHNATQPVSNTNTPAFTGTATLRCNNGALAFDAQSCVKHCEPQAVSWGAGCSYTTTSTINDGSSSGLTNTAGGYTGSVTVACANGVFTQSGASCAPSGGPVNGLCNNSVALGCTTGTMANDNGDTACGSTRTWHCNGSGGGSNDTSCSKANAACAPGDPCSDNGQGSGCLISGSDYGTGCVGNDIFGNGTVCCAGCTPPVNGVCDNSVALGCSAGTAGSDNGQTACGQTRTWVCQGSGGGSDSGTCSKANPVCTPDCYEKGDFGCAVSGDPCGTYHYTDGSTETDVAPRDWPNLSTPPPGWSFCSTPSACGNDCDITEIDGSCSGCFPEGGTYTTKSSTPSCFRYSCSAGLWTYAGPGAMCQSACEAY